MVIVVLGSWVVEFGLRGLSARATGLDDKRLCDWHKVMISVISIVERREIVRD